MAILITIIMKTDTMMLILMNLKCLKLLKSFYYTSEMLLMKEWYMKCKIYMKTRMLLIHLVHIIFLVFHIYIYLRFPKLSDQFFDKAPWPSKTELSTIMDDDKVL